MAVPCFAVHLREEKKAKTKNKKTQFGLSLKFQYTHDFVYILLQQRNLAVVRWGEMLVFPAC